VQLEATLYNVLFADNAENQETPHPPTCRGPTGSNLRLAISYASSASPTTLSWSTAGAIERM
jgi:hypothetical protein